MAKGNGKHYNGQGDDYLNENGRFATGNPGRQEGSKNKRPNIRAEIEALDNSTEDRAAILQKLVTKAKAGSFHGHAAPEP